MIPLIGGHTVGAEMAAKTKPKFIISYPEFMCNDQHARNYYPDVPYILLNSDTNKLLTTEEVDNLMTKIKFDRPDNDTFDISLFDSVDFINTTAPCSGLSMMNSSVSRSDSSRGSNAIQNKWIYNSAEFILENIKPKVLFGENAPGLYTLLGEGVVEKLKEIGNKYGYSVSLYKTNTLYHGIPQKRERTFYFFWKSEHVPIFDYYRREHKTLTEYLKEVPKDSPNNDIFAGQIDFAKDPYYLFLKYKEGDNWRNKMIENKTITTYLVKYKLLDEMLEWIDNVYEVDDNDIDSEKNKINIIKYIKHVKNKISMGKGWWEASPHFFGDVMNAIIGRIILYTIHPTELRGLTIRECMHMMGLPHDFTIPHEKFKNHIGQNVPTCTARDMTIEVIKFVNNEANMSKENFIKQSNSAQKIDTIMNKQIVKALY